MSSGKIMLSMRTQTLDKFNKNFKEEIKDLPLMVTKDNKPLFVIKKKKLPPEINLVTPK